MTIAVTFESEDDVDRRTIFREYPFLCFNRYYPKLVVFAIGKSEVTSGSFLGIALSSAEDIKAGAFTSWNYDDFDLYPHTVVIQNKELPRT